jgi:hypothetical protein
VGLWLAGFIAAWTGAGELPPCGVEVFRVSRNTNANVVIYEARLASAGVLDEREPVHPVWLMLAEDGRREELNLFEAAMAYGVEVRWGGDAEAVAVAIRARPELDIRILLEKGCPVARTRIAGREATLRLVAVEASGGLLPEVVWVDMIGHDRVTGADVRERVFPSE